MNRIILTFLFFVSGLYSQSYKLGIYSSLNTSISEEYLNLIPAKPTNTHIYLYGIDTRVRLIESGPLYSGINFQYGKKTILAWYEPFIISIDSLDFSYIKTEREITLLFLKIPVFYSVYLNKHVRFNFGLYFGWNQFKLNNTGDMILDSGAKYTDISDEVITHKFFIEPSIELDIHLLSSLNFLFGIGYKQIQYSIISKRKTDFLNIDFYTEKYRYSLSGLYYSVGLYVNVK